MKLITLYLAAIVAANLLIAQFGAEISILNAFLFIGLDLSSRDALHEQWGTGWGLWLKMLALILAGSILSALFSLNALPIAIASFVAFLAAGIGDALIYQVLHKQKRLIKMNGSNVISAAIDSLIFPALAFGFPLLWGIVLGQFVAKVAGGFMWSLILKPPKIRGSILI